MQGGLPTSDWVARIAKPVRWPGKHLAVPITGEPWEIRLLSQEGPGNCLFCRGGHSLWDCQGSPHRQLSEVKFESASTSKRVWATYLHRWGLPSKLRKLTKPLETTDTEHKLTSIQTERRYLDSIATPPPPKRRSQRPLRPPRIRRTRARQPPYSSRTVPRTQTTPLKPMTPRA